MDKEKQVEGMTKEIQKYVAKQVGTIVLNCEIGRKHKRGIAEHLINQDYRKVVRCKDCRYLMFSDCYGECSKRHLGIVDPNDFCSRGERRKK